MIQSKLSPIGRSLAAAIFWLVAGHLAPALAREVWFAPPLPRPDVLDRLRNQHDNDHLADRLSQAQLDWDRFFTPETLDKLAPLMQVYAVTTGSVLGMPDAELKTKLNLLLARHVRLAFVTQPVIVSDPSCGHTEGYDSQTTLDTAIVKLKRLNLDISILAMDGGLWFGHYAQGDQECRLSLGQTIADVALTIKSAAAAFPGISVVDIEPTVPLTREPDWQNAFTLFKNGLETVTGTRLSALHLDIAWNSAWQQAVREETMLARRLGMQIGYIYNGDGEDRSDAAWLVHARRNIAEMEGGLGLIPDQVSISSWNDYPTRSVRDPVDGTLASLLVYYAQPGMRIALDRSTPRIEGRVLDFDAHFLPGVTVTLEAAGRRAADGKLPIQRITGIVPDRARSAIIGLRINAECLCSGDDDVVLGDIRYSEAGAEGRSEVRSFLADFHRLQRVKGADQPTVHVLAPPSDTLAQITATPAETLILNARPFAVTPGASFTLSAPVLNLSSAAMMGTITVIWIDDAKQGLKRDNLIIPADFSAVRTIRTDEHGAFSFDRLASLGIVPSDVADRPTRLEVNIQNGHRGAIADISR